MQTLSKASASIENIFNELDKQFILFSTNSNVNMFLVAEKVEGSFAEFMFIRGVHELIKSSISASTNIYSIHIYSRRNNYVMSSQNGNYIESFSEKTFYEHYLETDETNFIISTVTDVDSRKRQMVSRCYGIYSNEKLLGLLVINIAAERFNEITKSTGKYDDQFYMLSGEKNVIFNKLNTSESDLDSLITLANTAKIDRINISNNSRFITATTKLQHLDITLISQIDSGEFKHIQTNLLVILLICVILAIILPLAITLYMSLQVYSSIASILGNFHTIVASNLDDRKHTNEVTFISRNILNFLTQNKNFEQELVESISALKKVQSYALQMQFNPHFLFNTLNHISVIIMQLSHGKSPADKMIKLLSDLLSESLNTKEYIISVKDEVSYAKKYIELESIKYKESFECLWYAEKEVLSYKTIKLILQPILENAIVHGVRYLRKKRKGIIKVSATLQDQNIKFVVYDNGVGIKKNQLEKIQSRLDNHEFLGNKHIGLLNVHQRIRLIFGEAYGLSIASDEEGTVVTLTLPAIKI